MSRKIISILIIICTLLTLCACTSSNNDSANGLDEKASVKIGRRHLKRIDLFSALMQKGRIK